MVAKIIDEVIRREGGFVNNPNDPGGATNMGITQKTLSEWRGKPVTVEDVRNLTRQEAFEIYHHKYVKQPKFDLISDGKLQDLIIDSGVLFGTVTAARWLQDAIGVRPDGVIGPVTLTKLRSADPHDARVIVLKRRLERIGYLVSHNAKQRRSGQTSQDISIFTEGWIRRTLEFL